MLEEWAKRIVFDVANFQVSVSVNTFERGGPTVRVP